MAVESYNTIPNVNETNNKFDVDQKFKIVMPTGTYEVKDISKYIDGKLAILSQAQSKDYKCTITTNNNTLQTIIKANFDIDFTPDDSIGRLLGLEAKHLTAGHELATPLNKAVDIFKVDSVSIEYSFSDGLVR